MRFEPRRPDASVNVSKTHPLAEAGTLFVGIGLMIVAFVVALVFAVELLIRFVPPQTEARWLAGWSPMETSAPESPPELAAAELLQSLADQWPEAPYTFRLGVTDEKLPNAFALPGGMIVVTRGLLDRMQSENALAFVLAHELGHFYHRDHVRQLGRATALGLFLAGLSASESSGVGMTLTDLTLRGFGRQQEADADAFALGLVEAHYGHVGDALSFFESLSAEGEGSLRWAVYLGTHPVPSDRVVALRDQAAQAGWSSGGEPRPWPPASAP